MAQLAIKTGIDWQILSISYNHATHNLIQIKNKSNAKIAVGHWPFYEQF